jgi:ADP-heptose:LPS heptosyltransferase
MAPARLRPALTRLVDYGLRAPVYLLGSKISARVIEPRKRSPRRLLIVKVHGMGDSVLIRALIELIQRSHAEVEIGVLVGSATHELMTVGLHVQSHRYDQKQVTPLAIASTWCDIRRNRYEAIANFEQGSLAGAAFLASAGIGVHVGFVGSDEDPKCRLLSHPVTFRESDSMWQSFLKLAKVLYPDLPDGCCPSIGLHGSPESKRWAAEWWQSRVGGADRFAVAMHLGCGSGMDFRRWPLERFLALGEKINSRWRNVIVILTGTTLERDLIRQFCDGFRGNAVDASGLGSIEKTALILKRCHLLVSNDTGVMHLGAAVGTPTVGLFGPNSPVHWAPLGKRVSYVRDTSARCSPCVNNYRNLIPMACTNSIVGQCMKDIAVESVESAIERLLGEEKMLKNHDSDARATEFDV